MFIIYSYFVFSHHPTCPYLCRKSKDMGGIFDITLPHSWAELTDRQLLMVFSLFARDLAAAEVKTLCLMKWNRIRVITQLQPHRYLVKRGRQQTILTSKQIQTATATLDFLDNIPTTPVRISRIGKHRALPANFEEVPFEKYLYVENLFQGFLHTQDDGLLSQITQILYDSEKLAPSKAEQVNTFYWVAALKQYFATQFPHFFQPVDTLEKDGDLLKSTPSLYTRLRDATNAQIRALTGGDITKEPTILKMDTIRALTELDAKAADVEEIRRQSKT